MSIDVRDLAELSKKGVARTLGVHFRTLNARIEAGEFPHGYVTATGKWRITIYGLKEDLSRAAGGAEGYLSSPSVSPIGREHV